MASKIVTPDLEKSYGKDTDKINAMVVAAMKDGVVRSIRTPSGRIIPVVPSSEVQRPKSS